MSTAPQKRFTFEEYLAWEEQQLEKHEFFHGEVFAMAGATFEHGAIIANLISIIKNQSDRSGCRPNGPDLRVRCLTGLCTYPDVVVICEKPKFEEDKHLVLSNPKMIFEVLSPSTAAYDRGDKFLNYRSIKSLTHYVLVSQNRSLVEVYERGTEMNWNYQDYQTGAFELPGSKGSIQFELSAIYEGIEFPEVILQHDQPPES